ncbi:hypothetical protein AB0J74_14065 [Asanoa sp. NPDC049573]|uniref:Rv0361 family membrane protein n=1 Tax=Asanoa sp. NPDC049573 TaxID=3155396 RepID=UPI0034155B31
MNPMPGPPEIPPGPHSGYDTPAPDSPAPAPGGSPLFTGPPPPPQGPGVVPPFAAPPTEGRTMRLWFGLGAAGLFLLLCCGGGAVALSGLTIFGVQALDERARVAATDYVSALERSEYAQAYSLLCEGQQARQTATEFAREQARAPRISSFVVRKTEMVTSIVVPVDLVYASGSSSTVKFVMEQDTGTGDFEVCGTTD